MAKLTQKELDEMVLEALGESKPKGGQGALKRLLEIAARLKSGGGKPPEREA